MFDGQLCQQFRQNQGFHFVQATHQTNGIRQVTIGNHAVMGKGLCRTFLKREHQKGMGQMLEGNDQIGFAIQFRQQFELMIFSHPGNERRSIGKHFHGQDKICGKLCNFLFYFLIDLACHHQTSANHIHHEFDIGLLQSGLHGFA